MRYRTVLSGALLLLSLGATALGEEYQQAEEVARARNMLLEKLDEAKTSGVVRFKDAAGEAALNVEQSNLTLIEAPAPAAPALRESYYGGVDCLSAAELSAMAVFLGDRPLQKIESMRADLAVKNASDAGWIQYRIAEAYLVIGFYEESIAAASALSDPKSTAIRSIARILSSSQADMIIGNLNADGCGDTHEFIAKLAGMTPAGMPEFRDAEIEIIQSMPDQIAHELFDRISVAAIEAGDISLASRIESARNKLPERPKNSQESIFIKASISNVGGVAAAEASSGDLLSLAEDPGPLRLQALSALAKRRAFADFDAGKARAYFSNLEDAVRDVGVNNVNRPLVDALVVHRLKTRDISGAVELVAKSWPTEERAISERGASLNAILGPRIKGESPSEKFAALAAAIEHAEVVASNLDREIYDIAANDLAATGAVSALARFLDYGPMTESEKAYLLARAHLYAGDFAAAGTILRGHETGSEFLELATAIAMEGEDESFAIQLEKLAFEKKRFELSARLAWKSADWRRAATSLAAANIVQPSNEFSGRILLARAAEAEFNPANAPGQSNKGGERPPNEDLYLSVVPSKITIRSLEDFTEQVSDEVAFLRKRIPK